MNIQSLIRKIELFDELIIESGFKRDVEGYISSIAPQQNRQNFALFKDISSDIEEKLGQIYDSDLPDSLNDLFPDQDPVPFTEGDHLDKIRKINGNTELATPQFFDELNTFLNNLKNQIVANETKLDLLRTVFEVYVSSDQEGIDESKEAIISLIFKDEKTLTSLKEFSKTLNRWNRTLHIYHLLLTSETQEEIELVEVQNGSIDVIVNIDVDIAIDFVELVKLGFEVYGGYLLYKSKVGDIIKTYFGNKILIKQEQEREKAMLENISQAIETKLLEQHKEAKKGDKNIDKTSINTKVKDVTNVLSEHIVKGNDIKLLSAPKNNKEMEVNAEEIRKKSTENRRLLKQLPEEEKIKLIDKFTVEDDEENKK